MKPSQVKQAVKHIAIDKRRPVMIWGAPGGGKTDVINQLAAEEDRQLIDFRLAMRDPTDIKGFPMPDLKKGLMRFLRDEELPREGRGILFLDEINSGSQATMACAMQLMLTRQIGSYRLPDDWVIVAAGNRETDRSVVNRMPSALNSRMVHIDYEVDTDDWCKWAMKDNRIDSKTVGFIRFRPALLSAFDPKERSYPVPRTWQFADELMRDVPMGDDAMLELLSGTVGKGAAIEYLAFYKNAAKMPNIDKVFVKPETVEVPEALDVKYATTSAVAQRTTANNFDRAMVYIQKFPLEFQTAYIKDCVGVDEGVCDTKAFQSWVIANNDVMV